MSPLANVEVRPLEHVAHRVAEGARRGLCKEKHGVVSMSAESAHGDSNTHDAPRDGARRGTVHFRPLLRAVSNQIVKLRACVIGIGYHEGLLPSFDFLLACLRSFLSP